MRPAIGGRHVAVIVDGEKDEISLGEFERGDGFGEGDWIGAVGEPEGDGGRDEEDRVGWGEVGEVELDEAIVDVVGTVEDVEVGSSEDDIAVAEDLVVGPGSGGRHLVERMVGLMG